MVKHVTIFKLCFALGMGDSYLATESKYNNIWTANVDNKNEDTYKYKLFTRELVKERKKQLTDRCTNRQIIFSTNDTDTTHARETHKYMYTCYSLTLKQPNPRTK